MKFFEKELSVGTKSRNQMLDITSQVQSVVKQSGIANGDAMVGHPYNVGLDDANLSKEELAFKVKEHVPNFVILNSEIGVDPDKRNYIVSNQRLRESGFEARRSLDEGIRELLKAYRMMVRQAFKNV